MTGAPGTSASSTAPAAVSPRTRLMLEEEIIPTLFRLAAPNALNLIALTVIVSVDALFLGPLGSATLAGVSLVFPLKMLMQHMSAAGMGGAVASLVARAIGGGRRKDAAALAAHALVVAGALALLFTAAVLLGGRALFAALGGRGEALEVARVYSAVIFLGALAPWMFNTLASIVRGTGNMTLPAASIAGCAALDLLLSPALIFGWGPFPRLGVTGAALGFVSSFGLGTAALALYLASGRGPLRPSLSGGLQARHFSQVLKVGLPASLNPVAHNLTVVLVTGLAAGFGAPTLAGYGVGARVEYVIIPVVFGFGTALLTMVATNVGAGQRARAERIAWTGSLVVGGTAGLLGGAAALFPGAWMGLFTEDPAVLAAGSSYLRIAGPFYGFFAMGLALFFASAGFGRPTWAVMANFLRLAVAAGGGVLATRWLGLDVRGLFAAVATAFVAYCAGTVLAIKLGAWGEPLRGAAGYRSRY